MIEALLEITKNNALICAAMSWLVAQVLKFLISIVVHRQFCLSLLVSSGGMPSSHAATVCALTTTIGYEQGLASPEFAMAFVLAFVVMYDAAGVRRAAGEQAKLLNGLMRDIQEGRTDDMQRELKELIGHTPLQVFAGAVLGVCISAAYELLL